MLENSIKELERLTEFKDAPPEAKGEGEEARKCWNSLRPLVVHELMSITQAIQGEPIYSSPEGNSQNDPLLAVWIPKWREGSMVGYDLLSGDSTLNIENGGEWERHIVNGLRDLTNDLKATGHNGKDEMSGALKRFSDFISDVLTSE